MCPKNAVHARMSTLYRLAEFVKPNISSIRSEDQGHFIQVRAQTRAARAATRPTVAPL